MPRWLPRRAIHRRGDESPWRARPAFCMLAVMDAFEIPIEVLRLAEAIVFASPEPVTWQRLGPLLPRDLDPGVVFAALERHCAGRGVILAKAGRRLGLSHGAGPGRAGQGHDGRGAPPAAGG